MIENGLGSGDLLPEPATSRHTRTTTAVTRQLLKDLARTEAPGINTLVNGTTRMVIASALGANLLDTDGNRTIDLVSGFGVALLGHRHPSVVQAIKEQADTLVHGLGDVYANPQRIELARALCQHAPQQEAQVYLAVSGSDAVEIALKTAVLHTGRSRVLAFDPGYHGLTMGSLQATSRPAFREPFRAHAGQHVTRLPFGCEPDRVAAELAEHDVAAVLFEPIVGREGVLFPPHGWVSDVLASARATNTVSIADEIFTGMRRCGPWFAHCPPRANGNSQGQPSADLICCGKALGGGLPIGAVLGTKALFAQWDTGGEALHTGTFVGHPLACAAACAALRELERPWVSERLRAIELAFERLAAEACAAEGVSVRGQGALWAIECASRDQANSLVDAAHARGLVVLAGGPTGRVVQLVPPLVITDQQLAYVVDTLADLLSALPRRTP